MLAQRADHAKTIARERIIIRLITPSKGKNRNGLPTETESSQILKASEVRNPSIRRIVTIELNRLFMPA
jgi:hypothetical protein